MEKQINKGKKYSIDDKVIDAFKQSKSKTLNEFLISPIEESETSAKLKRIMFQNNEIYKISKTLSDKQEYSDKNMLRIIHNQNALTKQNDELIRLINAAAKGLDE